MTRLGSEDGVALTEMLVALAVSLVVLGAAVEAFTGFVNVQLRSNGQVQAQDTARMAVDRMAHELRSAMSAGTTGDPPIRSTWASSYDVVYLAPDSSVTPTSTNPRGLNYVRYCLEPADDATRRARTYERLYRQTTRYDSATQPDPPSTPGSTTGCANNTAWTTEQLVASQLVNRLSSPAPPLFGTVSDSTGSITDVRLNAVVDADTDAPPPATELRSSVTLRNLNRVPTAALNCQPQTNSRVFCDASASTDPDGQTLSFQWSMDGSQLTETNYRLDRAGLAPSGTYTFTVKVTDSGGVSATATRTVTLPLL